MGYIDPWEPVWELMRSSTWDFLAGLDQPCPGVQGLGKPGIELIRGFRVLLTNLQPPPAIARSRKSQGTPFDRCACCKCPSEYMGILAWR